MNVNRVFGFFKRAVWPWINGWVVALGVVGGIIISYNIAYLVFDHMDWVFHDPKSKCTIRACHVRIAIMITTASAAVVCGMVGFLIFIIWTAASETVEQHKKGAHWYDTPCGAIAISIIFLTILGAIATIGAWLRLFSIYPAMSGLLTVAFVFSIPLTYGLIQCTITYCKDAHDDIKEQYLAEIVVEQAKEN